MRVKQKEITTKNKKELWILSHQKYFFQKCDKKKVLEAKKVLEKLLFFILFCDHSQNKLFFVTFLFI